MKTLKFISQILIFLLALDAAWIAAGRYQGWVMWAWIVEYWVTLTVKNLVDYIANVKEGQP